jgi:phospholipid/cholesterol/gamma-HCH transport system substrate-binding protein
MATKAQKIRVGVFTAVCGTLIAVVLVTFGGLRFWEKRDEYRIVFDDSVMGLESGSLVYLNGMKVGSVKRIEVAPEDLRKVAVTIEIKDGVPVKQDTKALLQYAGITGLRVIDLRGGTYASAVLPPGSTITTGKTTLDKLEERAQSIVARTETIMQRVDDILANVQTISNPKQFEAMPEIMAQAKVTADNLATTSATLKTMANENRAAIRATVESVNQSAERATEILDTEVASILRNANATVASVKNVVTSNQSLLRSALFDLRQATKSFKELARDLRQKPSRLISSDAPSERKLP